MVIFHSIDGCKRMIEFEKERVKMVPQISAVNKQLFPESVIESVNPALVGSAIDDNLYDRTQLEAS